MQPVELAAEEHYNPIGVVHGGFATGKLLATATTTFIILGSSPST